MKNREIIPHIERACTWSLNTIIWSYHSFVIINTDIMAKNKKFSNEEQIKILDKISNGHIPYQQSLLTYLVYYLGACAENCNINNISFKVEKKNISNLINYFFKTANKYQKDKNFGYQPSIFKLDNKIYNFNKSIIKAHQPKLNQSEIINIAEWFVSNLYKDTNIQRVFIGARHYFHLENTGFMNKVAGAGKSSSTALLKLKPGHFNKFEGTGLDKYVPLRFSYILMNLLFSKKIFYNYLNNLKKRLKKVKEFSKGPYVSLIIKKTLYFNNKTAKYFGEVKYDPIHGKWTNSYKDGSIIKVPYIMHGKGTYTYKEGSIIKGTWLEGKIHGKCIIDAHYFSAKTIDGKYVGEDSGPISGLFNKDKPQGIFKWKMKSGRSYIGRVSIIFLESGVDITFSGRGTLKHPGRGGLVQGGIWKSGRLKKQEKSNSPFLTFVSSINNRNLNNDSKYYEALEKMIVKIKFNEMYIYSIKNLPYKKDRIKLALKRLLMAAAMTEDNGKLDQNILNRQEDCFKVLANFQATKKIKPTLIPDTYSKYYKLYVKETKAFKDYIEFCSEKHFKYPEKMMRKIWVDKNKKIKD